MLDAFPAMGFIGPQNQLKESRLQGSIFVDSQTLHVPQHTGPIEFAIDSFFAVIMPSGHARCRHSSSAHLLLLQLATADLTQTSQNCQQASLEFNQKPSGVNPGFAQHSRSCGHPPCFACRHHRLQLHVARDHPEASSPSWAKDGRLRDRQVQIVHASRFCFVRCLDACVSSGNALH